MKPRLHFHSDAAFFAGCENMLVNFFADRSLSARFSVTFTYRDGALYREGLLSRVPSPPGPGGVAVLDVTDVTEAPPPGPLRSAAKVLGGLLFLRVWIFAYDVCVLRRAFGRTPLDVLHVNNGGWPGAYSCHAAVVAARLCGVSSVVYVVNNIAVPYRGFRRWVDWPIDRLVVSLTDVFVAASSDACRALREVLGVEPRMIPNGVGLRAISESPSALRARLGIPSGRLLAVSVSLLVPRKGHRHLLGALHRLKRSGKEIPFLVVEGEGEERVPLEGLVRDLGLQEDVRFAGSQSRAFDLINAADVFVDSSIRDSPSPNVVVEAMALGKPVLASVRCSPDQVRDGRDGLLVDPCDEAALADALGRLSADRGLRETLGRAAASAWRERFSAEAATAAYRALYEELPGGRPR